EAHVVAGGQADSGAVQVDRDQLVPGGDGVGLPRAVGVEQVDLAVLGADPAAAGDQGVVHAAVVGGAEGPGHHGDPVGGREVLEEGDEGLVALLGGAAQVRAEGSEGGLGQQDQLCTGRGAVGDGAAHGPGGDLRVLVDTDLGQGDSGSGRAAHPVE